MPTPKRQSVPWVLQPRAAKAKSSLTLVKIQEVIPEPEPDTIPHWAVRLCGYLRVKYNLPDNVTNDVLYERVVSSSHLDNPERLRFILNSKKP